MATPRDPETGKFKPPPGGVTEADGAALDRKDDDDDGRVAPEPDLNDSPRYRAMQRQRVARAKEMGAEIVEDAEEEDRTGDAHFQQEERAKIGERGEEEEAKAKPEGDVDPAAAAPTIADDTVVEVKVNGETKKLPWSEAKKHLQIGLATEETLADAKRTREAADAELLAARAARKIVGEGEPEAGKPAPKELTAEEKAKKVVDDAKTELRAARRKHAEAVQFGTPEEIQKAETVLSEAEDKLDDARDAHARAPAAATQPTDPLVERELVDTNKAEKKYNDGFAEDRKDEIFNAAATLYLRREIVKDLTGLGADENILRKLTDQEIGVHHFRARSRGLVRTLDEVFTAAGTKAREELKSRSSGGTPPRTPVDERQQRKEDTPPAPRIAAGRIPEPEGDKPKSNQDLIAEARRRRGKG